MVASLDSSPLVPLLLASLAKAGCPTTLARHVVCEPLPRGLLGGYDRELNQVVLCSEKCTDLGLVETILSHELVHMYDQCTARVDWQDVGHLACSEVRAANLVHCLGPLSGALRDGAPPFSSHAACVEAKAVRSVKAVAGLGEQAARAAVREVFTRCYNDLEPVGRRCKGWGEQELARREAQWLAGREEASRCYRTFKPP